MPCFNCICFKPGRGRNGEHLPGGKGYCELRDEEYSKHHECRKYAPKGWGPKTTRSPLKEPSSCFISSACAEYMGLPDDCEELTVLRSFRDQVLKSTPEGNALVEEYYRIAPPLVEKILSSPEKEKIFKEIYDRILACIDVIRQEKNDEAVLIYREMVDHVRSSV